MTSDPIEAPPSSTIALALVPDRPVHHDRSLGGLPYLADYMQLANSVHRTEMVPQALRGRADAVLAVILAGHELGIGPMQALQGINLIQGRPSVSPELMRALVLAAGHSILIVPTDTSAVARCHRSDWPFDEWVEFTWTLDDAQRAGLTSQTWSKYPRAMLAARVTSEACRQIFPDVIAGMSYTPEEVLEFTPSQMPEARPVENWVQPETIGLIRDAIKALAPEVRETRVDWPTVLGVELLRRDESGSFAPVATEAAAQEVLAALEELGEPLEDFTPKAQPPESFDDVEPAVIVEDVQPGLDGFSEDPF